MIRGLALNICPVGGDHETFLCRGACNTPFGHTETFYHLVHTKSDLTSCVG